MEEKLREAACFGDTDALHRLLEAGADVNGQHKINGWTALHWAAKRNNMRIVDALLKSGADVNLYTSKGEQAYQLSTNEHIAKVLMTKDAVAKARKQRQHSGSGGNRSRDSSAEKRQTPTPTDPSTAPQNYLRHPQLGYQVDVSDIPEEDAAGEGVAINHAVSNHDESAGKKKATPSFRILKVRLVGREDFDRDFIEIDVPMNALSFRNLVEIICDEFSVNPKTIVKLRKLPNTKLRRDIEVQRLEDYQELEVEVLDI